MIRTVIPPDQLRRIPDGSRMLAWFQRLMSGADVTRDPPEVGAPKRCDRKRKGRRPMNLELPR